MPDTYELLEAYTIRAEAWLRFRMQNAAGVPLRHTAVCSFEHSGGAFRLARLEIDGRPAGSLLLARAGAEPIAENRTALAR